MSGVDTDICNSALVKLGVNRILSLDDTSVEGRTCKEQYPKILKSLLRSHPWKFAIVRASLNKLVQKPAFEFDYYYQVTPEEILKVANEILQASRSNVLVYLPEEKPELVVN